MNKIKLLLFITSYSFLICNLNAQTAPKCKWVGTVTAQLNNPNIPQRNETLTGTVVYEYNGIDFALTESYKLTGGHMTWSVAGGTLPNGCKVKSNSISFSVDSVQLIADDLVITEDGNYYGSAGFVDLSLNFNAVHTDCQNQSADEPPFLYAIYIGQMDSTFLNEDVMAGSFTQSFITWSWNLHREGTGEIKLEVESNQYDSWLPIAGKNENEYGAPLVFTAKLLEQDGSTACQRAKKFLFQLMNVSKEPGVALNFPDADNAKDDYDIHFLAEFNAPGDKMSSDRLSVETKGGSQALAALFPFDWGAFADLKVTAYLQNGDSITGYLAGHPEITQIPIPRRTGSSKVADKWKEDKGISLSDDDDDENQPEGDGDNGDGLTLYEEYRGFYENGSHKFGDPKRKDLFVYTALDKFKPGIRLFKSLTQLNVHYNLNSDEFDTDTRLINFNHSSAPHQTNQHGVFVDKTDDGTSHSAIGPPKNVDTVNISDFNTFKTILRGKGKEITNNLNSTVAHELGHALRIEHHGPLKGSPVKDKDRLWQTIVGYDLNSNDVTYEFTEDGVPIDVRWENDKPYGQAISGEQYIAVWGGQHSGFSDCIMRYDVAYAYIPGPGTTSSIRYLVLGNERTGLQLCNKKEDSAGGINYLNRNPRPRYGSASNGNCRSQICVSDKYH